MNKFINDCPKAWEEADKWIKEANKDIDNEDSFRWSFDCGYKLDYDGGLVVISSRFYPPSDLQGDGQWDGQLNVMIGEEYIKRIQFNCDSLDELKEKVEKRTADIIQKAKILLQEL